MNDKKCWAFKFEDKDLGYLSILHLEKGKTKIENSKDLQKALIMVGTNPACCFRGFLESVTETNFTLVPINVAPKGEVAK